jgi:A118 family predicted phage portal protein
MDKVRERLDVYLQRGLALGAMIIKPLGDDKFQCIPQNGFIIFEMDADGNPIDIAFPEMRTINKRYYTRVERHTLTANGLTITNKAYVSDSEANLGREIPLDLVEEWSNYVPAVVFPVDRMIFGYYRNPNDNTVDGTDMGVSIYDSALEKIRKADIQFGRLDYEFESARRRIHADTTMIKQVDNGAGGKSYQLDDIYIDVNGDKEDFFNEFSPSLRQDGFIAGLEEYRRDIEFDIGLSYGDLSNPQYVEKTATEINASKYRKRNTINHIQSQLRVCLDGLVYGFAFFNRLTTSGYEFSCEFKDSFLNDDQSEREEDRKDLANGTLRREEYRARWRNETLEEAERNLPEVAELSYAYTE